MANESTYALIQSLIPDIWEGALDYAKHNFALPSMVTVFNDRQGMTPRNVSEYKSTGYMDNLGETEDLTAEEYDRALLATLTPQEIGKQFVITDRRMETDDVANVMADAAREIGYVLGSAMERKIISNFGSLTGGTLGSKTSALTVESLIQAKVTLEANAIPGPYQAVLHPYAYLDIWSDWVGKGNTPPEEIRNRAQSNYFVTEIAGVSVAVPTLMPRQKTGAVYEIDASSATAGTFRVAVDGEYTDDLAFDISAANLDTALEGLSTVGTGGVAVTENVDVYTLTFSADIAGVPNLVVLDDENITGTITLVQDSVTSTWAENVVFTRDALALDMRRGLRIEPERDASLRSTELNGTMIFAHGIWRPARGVLIHSDVTAPDGT